MVLASHDYDKTCPPSEIICVRHWSRLAFFEVHKQNFNLIFTGSSGSKHCVACHLEVWKPKVTICSSTSFVSIYIRSRFLAHFHKNKAWAWYHISSACADSVSLIFASPFKAWRSKRPLSLASYQSLRNLTLFFSACTWSITFFDFSYCVWHFFEHTKFTPLCIEACSLHLQFFSQYSVLVCWFGFLTALILCPTVVF